MEIFKTKSERIEKYMNCPNSELIQKHIQDVDTVQQEIELRMREHQDKWAQLLQNEKRIRVRRLPNKFKSSDQSLNKYSLSDIKEVDSRSSMMMSPLENEKNSNSDSSVSFPLTNNNI